MKKEKEREKDLKKEEKLGKNGEFCGDNIVTLIIKVYRKFISPYKKPCCRFTPTCSQYALDAVREWGIVFGLSLAFWRILRCNPYSKGGNDPVPKNPFRKGKNGAQNGQDPDKN